jgi:hypothetical protein
MHNTLRRLVKNSMLLATASLCVAASTFATVTMKLTGPPPGPVMGGVYTSPYTATIDGVSTFVICDDYYTDVSIATPAWQATATSLASLAGESAASTVVKFDHQTTAAQQIDDYMAVAYLAMQLMSIDQSTTANQVVAGEISFAIWAVFAGPSGPFSSLTPTQTTAAQGYLDNARAATAGQSPAAFAGVTIYTPTPNMNASQEYITVSVAEAPVPVILGLDLLGVAGCLLFLRRRTTRSAR